MPLDNAPEFKVDKGEALNWLNSWGTPLVIGSLLLLLLFSYVFSVASAAVFVLFTALLSLFTSRIWKLRLDYKQWVAVGFHAVTLPTILDFVFTAFGLSVPFLMPVIYFMFIFAVLADERTNPVGGGNEETAVESHDSDKQ